MNKLLVLGAAIAAGAMVQAEPVTLETGDAVGENSFTSGANWSDGAAPSSGKAYEVSLGADGALRAPVSSASNETIAWPGGELTIGSATADGKLVIPQCGVVTANDAWSKVSFGSLVLNRGVIARDDIEPTGTKHAGGITGPAVVNATAANPFVFENTNRAFYVQNAFTGGKDSAILFRRTAGNTLTTDAIRFYLRGNNSNYHGQFIFDNVEASWYTSFDSTVWGANEETFRADAIVLKDGARMRTYMEFSDHGQLQATLTLPEGRGITVDGSATLQSHNITDVYADITGDKLTLMGTGDNASSRYFRFHRSLSVKEIVVDSKYFPRVVLMDDATLVPGTSVTVGSSAGNANCYFGAKIDISIQAKVYGACVLYSSARTDQTAYGVITLTEGSSLPETINLAVDPYPYAAGASRLPVLKVPTSVRETLTADQIVLNTFMTKNSGAARTDVEAEVETAGGCHTVYVRRSGAQANYRYVVTPASVGPDYVDDGLYQSWETAATNIEKAIAAAAAGNVIYIAKGVYDIAKTIVLEKDVNLVGVDPVTMVADKGAILDGGYPARTNRIMKLKKAKLNYLTFRHGASDGTGWYSQHATGGGAICLGDTTFRINNCDFIENHATGAGGAIASHGVNGSEFCTRCRFIGNTADGTGAAGQHQYDGVTVQFGYRDCIFSNNTAKSTPTVINSSNRGLKLVGCTFIANPGHAIAPGSCTMRNCLFDGTGGAASTASNARQAFYIGTDGSSVRDVTIRNYTTSNRPLFGVGKGTVERLVATNNVCNDLVHWYSDGDVATLTTYRHCLFADNTIGSTFLLDGYAYVGFENCTVANNKMKTGSSYFTHIATYYCRVAITNSIFWANGTTKSLADFNSTNGGRNRLSVGSSVFDVAVPEGSSAFNRAPGFLDAAHGDYTLKPGAFAREKGVKLDWMTDASLDFANNPRLVNRDGVVYAPDALPDPGCYEAQGAIPATCVLFLK